MNVVSLKLVGGDEPSYLISTSLPAAAACTEASAVAGLDALGRCRDIAHDARRAARKLAALDVDWTSASRR